MRVLVTGASGFVGGALAKSLSSFDEYTVVASSRKKGSGQENLEQVFIGDIHRGTDWSKALANVDVVVHVAGKAHEVDRAKGDSSRNGEHMEVNFLGTVNLAEQAARYGVKRFVFISSIAVYGLESSSDAIDESAPANPTSDYGRAKLESEQYLDGLSRKTGMEFVVIRPPLVYGSNAPGNFGKLLSVVIKSIPLPFKMIKSRRSFVSRENLVSFITSCIHSDKAKGQTFLISDDHDLSIPDLVELLAVGTGKRAFLFPVPRVILKAGALLLGKRKLYAQLCEPLRLDISKAKNELSWKPVVSAESAVVRAGQEHVSVRGEESRE